MVVALRWQPHVLFDPVLKAQSVWCVFSDLECELQQFPSTIKS